jgi:hypothetical protein
LWPFKQKQKGAVDPLFGRRWVYLGSTELTWVDKDSDKPYRREYIHFWGRGDTLKKRKVDVTGDGSITKRHPFYQQYVIPWLKDKYSNLFTPIVNPSEWFKIWTKNKTGSVFMDDKWVKPAPKYEKTDNIIQLPEKR